MNLDRKLYVTMSEQDYERLQELAATNSSGNLSAMIRILINKAYYLPSEMGLLPPKSFSTALDSAPIPMSDAERIPA